MNETQGLSIKNDDYLKISALISSAPPDIQDLLQTELDRATVIPDESFPAEIVAMNSTVVYLDIQSNQEKEITLVYPHESDISKNRISILAPVGAALIGLKVGQSIDWPIRPNNERTIKVIRVIPLDKPEAG